MTRKILHLPGVHCTHFLKGHCLLEEWRNPGLHHEWQCTMLQEWENEYDKFLTQAENFNLDLGVATRIWEQRLGGMMCDTSPCTDYEPVCSACKGGEECEEEIFCRHVWMNLCSRKLPLCPGVCQHYTHKKEQHD